MRYRANPLYELVQLDRLQPAERASLGGLDDDGVYAVLRPRPGAPLELRSASADTALLFLSLREPAPLPGYFARRLGEQRERTIARLVVDGVLEVEHEERFVSGTAAGELLLPERAAGGRGLVGELSRAALRYGAELAQLPPGVVGPRLYLFGRRPVTPALARALPDAVAVEAQLGISAGAAARRALAAAWTETVPVNGERAYWRTWQARRARADGNTSDAGYKLYVSPAIDGLAAAVETVASTLGAARGVRAFKVGAGVAGLCRPDKIVVYFDRLDDLRDGAGRLRERLDGCPAHGVPFTAAVTLDGLLSWGADPPVPGDGGAATSWRLWVCGRLADYLCDARTSEPGGLEPTQFALERLRLAGIDTETWVPSSGMWQEALASA